MRIFLSGPMGSGKSTVGRALARRLGRRCVDLDASIAEREGKSIEAIFRERGEAAFREMEREELGRVLGGRDEPVVALGGGTMTDRALRRATLGAGLLVTLTAPVSQLSARVASETGRPLLAGTDAREVLEHLIRSRAEAYAECHLKVDTGGRTPDEIAEEIAAVEAEPPIVVPLGGRTYRVWVGRELRGRAGAESAAAVSGRTALVATDQGVVRWASEVSATLRDRGFEVVEVVLPQGEEHKTVRSVERLWDAAIDGGLDRSAIVLGVGGGVVGDLAGFAASTFMRGVALGQVPTSLLAMVDSSVGGKTGFDRASGKNLVGTFHQPRFVLCDVSVLDTLPREERRAGLAEVVKSAWLDGEDATTALEHDAAALRAGDPDATARAIRASVALKARIVTEDERESGPRRLLNLGHTVGHAIEAALGFRGIRHGEAVALGMIAAWRVASHLGRANAAAADRMTRLLGALELPTDLDTHLSEDVLRFIGADKKRIGDEVHFVVPGDPGRSEILPIPVTELRRALS